MRYFSLQASLLSSGHTLRELCAAHVADVGVDDRLRGALPAAMAGDSLAAVRMNIASGNYNGLGERSGNHAQYDAITTDTDKR